MGSWQKMMTAAAILGVVSLSGTVQVAAQTADRSDAQAETTPTASHAGAVTQPTPLADVAGTLTPVIRLPHANTNGVATSPDGRIFMVIAAHAPGTDVPQVAEYVNGQLKPYPDAAWNAWKPGAAPSKGWLHANSIRFDKNGVLWVVDFGNTGFNTPVVPHGVKLVGIDISTNTVVQTVLLDSVVKPQSAVDDVRFNKHHLYLTDAGAPALIVRDMRSGAMWRALEGDKSTTCQTPLRAEGHQLVSKGGKPVYFGVDQIEISPDGQTIYYQPNCGPLSKIDETYTDNPNIPDSERKAHVQPFAQTGTAGGTAIDAAGNVYISDTNTNAVYRISPAGRKELLIRDPRLVWVDAMWISADGRLWMPAAQLDRTPDFNGGKFAVQYPMVVYTVKIGIGPAPNDHR